MQSDRRTLHRLEWWRALTLGLALAGVWSCSATATERLESLKFDNLGTAIIYESDDRIEALAYPDERLVELATTVVGALVPREYVALQTDGTYLLKGPRLADRLPFCAGEPFTEQPALSLCTAILTDNATLLTAGHCLRDTLQDVVFVRGYYLREGYPRVAAADVLTISRVLWQQDEDIATESGQDYALAQLSTSVTQPAADISTAAPSVGAGDPVVVIGTSEGLPIKIEAGGAVFDASPGDYFEVTTDTFVGSSGSPVFSPNGDLLGMMVGGAVDYEFNDADTCYDRVRRATPEARGEIVVRREVLAEAVARGLAADAAAAPISGCALTLPPLGHSAQGQRGSLLWALGLLSFAGRARRG